MIHNNVRGLGCSRQAFKRKSFTSRNLGKNAWKHVMNAWKKLRKWWTFQKKQSFDEKTMWIFQKLREKCVKNFFPLKILCTTKESTAPEFWRWRFAQLAETLWAAEQVEQAELRKKRAKWATKKKQKTLFHLSFHEILKYCLLKNRDPYNSWIFFYDPHAAGCSMIPYI